MGQGAPTASPTMQSDLDIALSIPLRPLSDLAQEWGLDPARLTLSSDSGGCLPRFDADGRLTHMDVGAAAGLLGTLSDLVAGGLPLERVLPLVTSNPADQYGLRGSFHPKGRLCAGADADLLVLDGSGRATDVMARGRWLVRGGDALVRGTFEADPTPA